MDAAIQRYRESHRHPVNRALHVVGLPLIVYSVAVFGRAVRVCSFLTVTDFLALVYVRNYYEYDASTLLPMAFFFAAVDVAAAYSVHNISNIYVYCVLLQAFAWFLQFAGHRYFERNRPVLLDSLFDSVSAAPLLLYYEVYPAVSSISKKYLM